MPTKIEDVLLKWEALKQRRDSWMDIWQQVSEVMHPNAGDFIRTHEPGERRTDDIFDAQPRIALRDLAATMDGLLKPKTSQWFEPMPADMEPTEDEEDKAWLDAVRDKMWNAIYRPDARFIQRSTEVDLSMVSFGHGVLWIQQNAKRSGLLFKSFPVSRIAIDEDAEGVVNVLAVEEKLTPAQAAEVFGVEKLHKKIRKEISAELRRTSLSSLGRIGMSAC